VDGCAWSIWPAALAPQAGGGGASVRAWPPESEFSPTAAGQEGWAVIGDPAGAIAADGAKPVRRAYFQKLV
jgi:hypothetical protein